MKITILYFAALREALGVERETVDLPTLHLPYLFTRSHGLRETRMVAEALGAEFGL